MHELTLSADSRAFNAFLDHLKRASPGKFIVRVEVPAIPTNARVAVSYSKARVEIDDAAAADALAAAMTAGLEKHHVERLEVEGPGGAAVIEPGARVPSLRSLAGL